MCPPLATRPRRRACPLGRRAEVDPVCDVVPTEAFSERLKGRQGGNGERCCVPAGVSRRATFRGRAAPPSAAHARFARGYSDTSSPVETASVDRKRWRRQARRRDDERETRRRARHRGRVLFLVAFVLTGFAAHRFARVRVATPARRARPARPAARVSRARDLARRSWSQTTRGAAQREAEITMVEKGHALHRSDRPHR